MEGAAVRPGDSGSCLLRPPSEDSSKPTAPRQVVGVQIASRPLILPYYPNDQSEKGIPIELPFNWSSTYLPVSASTNPQVYSWLQKLVSEEGP